MQPLTATPSGSNTMPPSTLNTMPPPPTPSGSNTIPPYPTPYGSNIMPPPPTPSGRPTKVVPLAAELVLEMVQPAEVVLGVVLGEHQFKMDMEAMYEMEREQIANDEDDQFWEDCVREFDHVEEPNDDKGFGDLHMDFGSFEKEYGQD
ncbi:hypothetical protein Tco_1058351 [Tanacetum coccineum]|uniref:Uncharacterized protein n=1 Tax=Tanacetum coccineum TaxID=301880 RepID=A0ABQ5H852_9ASTR